MTVHQSAYDESQGKPNLEVLQYLQDNWGSAEIAAAVRVEKVSITASGSSGVAASTIPVGAEIIAIENHCKATVGGGTARVRIAGGGANISDAMAMAVNDAVTRATTIDQTYKVVTVTGIEVVTNSDDDRGDVYIYYKK
jgi:hypothetical protein